MPRSVILLKECCENTEIELLSLILNYHRTGRGRKMYDL